MISREKTLTTRKCSKTNTPLSVSFAVTESQKKFQQPFVTRIRWAELEQEQQTGSEDSLRHWKHLEISTPNVVFD